eukprot:CAMPEP_0173453664 /NCGR_PEP_ID=MMETSP1357-20121228/51041_1 /TAXON_ID=77926 /ORGANISM="Hemiselmis rufescens, Strain PCC563" /LENGTH=194 /DNA_ID=CAMNT_0014420635 /DNA_START=310 /DNA_END=890 /DNA_ORIENTATION=+
MPGESQKQTDFVRKCVWMCLVCPGVREELTTLRPNMLFMTLLFPMFGSPTKHTVSASSPPLPAAGSASAPNQSDALQAPISGVGEGDPLDRLDQRGDAGLAHDAAAALGHVEGDDLHPLEPLAEVVDPRRDRLRGHEVTLVEEDDDAHAKVGRDVAVQGLGEVEEGAPRVEDQDGDGASLEAAPDLPPDLEVVL